MLRAAGKLVYDQNGVLLATFRSAESAQAYVQQQARISAMQAAIEEAVETLPKTYLLTIRTLKAALDK